MWVAHMTLKIAVGSTNPVKIRAVENVMKRIYDSVVVVSVAVDSGVGRQPLSLEETIKGAVNRALNALKAVKDAHLGVGIEAGLIEVPFTLTGYLDVQYCAIVDRRGSLTIGHGPGFEYPPSVVREVVERGVEVGLVMSRLTGIENLGRKMGAIGYLSRMMIDRTKLTELAVLMAMIPRLNPRLYGLA